MLNIKNNRKFIAILILCIAAIGYTAISFADTAGVDILFQRSNISQANIVDTFSPELEYRGSGAFQSRDSNSGSTTWIGNPRDSQERGIILFDYTSDNFLDMFQNGAQLQQNGHIEIILYPLYYEVIVEDTEYVANLLGFRDADGREIEGIIVSFMASEYAVFLAIQPQNPESFPEWYTTREITLLPGVDAVIQRIHNVDNQPGVESPSMIFFHLHDGIVDIPPGVLRQSTISADIAWHIRPIVE